MAQLVKNLPAMWATWLRSLGQGSFPGDENGSPLQYACLENSMGRGAWWVALGPEVHGVTTCWPRLSDEHTHRTSVGRLLQESRRDLISTVTGGMQRKGQTQEPWRRWMALAARRHGRGCKAPAWALRRIVVPRKMVSFKRRFRKTPWSLLAGATNEGLGS